MDDKTYQRLADDVLKRIEDLFVDVDAEDVDCERSGDVITLTMRGNRKCIVNTQRPTQQIWLAANARGYHFSFDESAKRWRDNRDASELFETLGNLVRETAGIVVAVQE
ncbi:MAG: iron donor protein CyaY [Polyangiaceae bacterium]